jgi:hypothetical protein
VHALHKYTKTEGHKAQHGCISLSVTCNKRDGLFKYSLGIPLQRSKSTNDAHIRTNTLGLFISSKATFNVN